MPTASLTPAPNELEKLPEVTSNAGLIGNTLLTIHRRTPSHYGSTLRALGHAAKYLADSRAAYVLDAAAEYEAIHILMCLSREVFDEYAVMTQPHPVTDWIMNQAVCVYVTA